MHQAFAADSCAGFVPYHTNQMFVTGKHSSCAESCQVCHKSAIWGGTPTSCKFCHTVGGYASTHAAATHIPTNGLDCDSCHLANKWTPTANMNHTLVSSLSCETCHNGAYRSYGADGKDSEHIPTTLTCSVCHKSTNNWDASLAAVHTGVVAGSCNTCHNGTGAKGKPAVHIATAASCDVCHLNYNSFSGAVMNHVGITGSCETCHNGVLAQGKSPNHPATPATCVTCHTDTSPAGNWACISGAIEWWMENAMKDLA